MLGQELAKLGLANRYDCPALSPVPEEAIRQIERLIAQRQTQGQTPVLIGSSLGGYYAHVLAKRHGLKAILINPVVWSGIDPTRFLGSHQNYHSGEPFEFTQQHINQLAALDTSIDHPERYLLMVETGDEVLNAEYALQHYAACPKIVVPGGEHGFASFGEHIAKVLVFSGLAMSTTYCEEDDILVIKLSDKPVAREVSQGCDTHISYAADGTTVEVVLLDAKANLSERERDVVSSFFLWHLISSTKK